MKHFAYASITLLFTSLFVIQANALVPERISLPDEIGEKLKSFEPSAVIYLNDLNLYLIGSDDTTEKDEPMLFLMDKAGEIQSPAVKVKGLKKMTDIESISQDDQGSLYLLGSQGLNKNGKDKEERNLFVRAERDGKKVKSSSSIVLRPLLLDALESSTDKDLKNLRSSFREELDVESHFIRDGDLYLGLKNPQPRPGTALIVRAGKADDILENEELNLQVWKTIDFSAITGEQDLLSDIHPVDGVLLLTTTQEEGAGRLWSYDESTGQLTMLQEFTSLRPEGVAYNSDQKSMMVVFDQGEEDALFAFGPLKK